MRKIKELLEEREQKLNFYLSLDDRLEKVEDLFRNTNKSYLQERIDMIKSAIPSNISNLKEIYADFIISKELLERDKDEYKSNPISKNLAMLNISISMFNEFVDLLSIEIDKAIKEEQNKFGDNISSSDTNGNIVKNLSAREDINKIPLGLSLSSCSSNYKKIIIFSLI